MAGRLFVVATPIGNLADLSARAETILRTVPTVACEDTRRSGPLLAHIGAAPRSVLALHDHNEAEASAAVLARLREGEDVAVVCDAGTPLVADPGFPLLRSAWDAGIAVIPIPGPSAVTAAVAVSPIPVDRFRFEGFLPARPAQRRKALGNLLASEVAVVFFEAPHRLRHTLTDLAALGGRGRPLLVCRELTKTYETVAFATVGEHLEALPSPPRGEFVCILAAATTDTGGDAETDGTEVLQTLCAELPPAQAARLASRITGQPRDELYALAVSMRRQQE